jgi:serine protease Do
MARVTLLIVICLLTTGLLGADEGDKRSQRASQRTQIVARALQSTVNIHTEKRQKSLDVVFSAGKSSKINGMGTGIVIDERGYVVTNFHVVQEVERLRVTTVDGDEYEARVIAYDSREDLAIIKIDPRRPLPVMVMGTSSDLMLGEDVIAIGNAYGYESTVTRGIVSHRSRDVEVNEEQAYRDLIQIDAAINPGNSGGPLINADGEVIGINVAIRAGAQRIGFAIPIDDARKTIARLMNIERHHQTCHGIATLDLKDGPERKCLVREVRPSTPAAELGLKDGDVILKSGEVEVIDGADLERSLFGKSAGAEVPLLVRRGEEELQLTLKLKETSPNRQRSGQQSLPEVSLPTTVAAQSPNDKCWEMLGMRLAKVSKDISLTGQPYRGGMQVTEVRPDSQADVNGIRKGDILVGLHVWETVNEDNIDYVLNHPQLSGIGPLKFYILRDGETLFGHFRVEKSR